MAANKGLVLSGGLTILMAQLRDLGNRTRIISDEQEAQLS